MSGGGARRRDGHAGSGRSSGFAPRVIGEAAAAAAVILAVTGLAGVVGSDDEPSPTTTTSTAPTTTASATSSTGTTEEIAGTSTTASSLANPPRQELTVAAVETPILVVSNENGTEALLKVRVDGPTELVQVRLGVLPQDQRDNFEASPCGKALTEAKNAWLEDVRMAPGPSSTTRSSAPTSTTSTVRTSPTPATPAAPQIIVILDGDPPKSGPWPSNPVTVSPASDEDNDLVDELGTVFKRFCKAAD